MKFINTISLFSVALLGHLTFTWQSSAPSSEENKPVDSTVSNNQVTECTTDCSVLSIGNETKDNSYLNIDFEGEGYEVIPLDSIQVQVLFESIDEGYEVILPENISYEEIKPEKKYSGKPNELKQELAAEELSSILKSLDPVLDDSGEDDGDLTVDISLNSLGACKNSLKNVGDLKNSSLLNNSNDQLHFGEYRPTIKKFSYNESLESERDSELISNKVQSKVDNNSTITSLSNIETKSNNSVNNSSELPWEIMMGLDSDSLYLDLTEDFSYLPFYTDTNLTCWNYSEIELRIDDKSDLSLLEKAFSGRTITKFKFHLDYFSNHQNIFELFEIIKTKQFKSFTFNSPNDTRRAEELIEKLGERVSFWSEMEYLDLWGFSKKQIERILNILSNVNSIIISHPYVFKPWKLKKLSMAICETNSKPLAQLKIPFVDDLKVEFLHKKVYGHEINDILSVFPKVKRIRIGISNELKSLKIIKIDTLERLEISCKQLSKFLEYLKKEPNLSSFHVTQIGARGIRLEKENNL